MDLPTVLRFKRMLLEHFSRTGTLLEHCLPFLASGEGMRLLLRSHALVIGLRHLADPAPIVRDALREPDPRVFEIDFAGEFANTLTALLYGLEQQVKQL